MDVLFPTRTATDVLIFACELTRAPTPLLATELCDIRACLTEAGWTVAELHGGGAAELCKALSQHRPRILHFIGHADAIHGQTQERTLALTNDCGQLVLALPTTLADLLCGCPSLELCFFNGCMSAGLARSVADRGVPAVGWQDAVIGMAAAVVAPEIYREIARLPRDRPLDAARVRAAYEQGLARFAATIADRRRGMLPTGRAIERDDDGVLGLRFELAHPLAAVGSLQAGGDADEAQRLTQPRKIAAGIPILMLPADAAARPVPTSTPSDHHAEHRELERARREEDQRGDHHAAAASSLSAIGVLVEPRGASRASTRSSSSSRKAPRWRGRGHVAEWCRRACRRAWTLARRAR